MEKSRCSGATNKEDTLIQALMAEGYREMGEENRREAEEVLNLTREVILRDDEAGRNPLRGLVSL